MSKKIIQILSAPSGWFALFAAYEEENELTRIDGYFAVPVAGWALCEDIETGKQKIEAFLGDGELITENSGNIPKIVFRPDWLNHKLNGEETVLETATFDSPKNRLEFEQRKSLLKATYEGLE